MKSNYNVTINLKGKVVDMQPSPTIPEIESTLPFKIIFPESNIVSGDKWDIPITTERTYNSSDGYTQYSLYSDNCYRYIGKETLHTKNRSYECAIIIVNSTYIINKTLVSKAGSQYITTNGSTNSINWINIENGIPIKGVCDVDQISLYDESNLFKNVSTIYNKVTGKIPVNQHVTWELQNEEI